MSKRADLFTALAKAQGSFPVIPKDKTVKVTMKSGGTYTFNYAPLDTIINAVRQPLAENGLSFFQTIKDAHVVTVVAHQNGACVSLAPVKILQIENGPQALGSALTYARRYSFTLALGIVSDEDDDGNTAEGNKAEKKDRRTPPKNDPPPPPAEEDHNQKYIERVKAALRAVYGNDTKAGLDKVEELSEWKDSATGEVKAKGTRDFRTLKGKRLEILCHNLEKLVPKDEIPE